MESNLKSINHESRIEKGVAVASFVAAVALAFTSVIISKEHDVAAGVLIMCAQLLTLTATIFGINYKFSLYDYTKRN